MNIYNLKDKPEYLKEIAELTQKEWGSKNLSSDEFEAKVNKKILQINFVGWRQFSWIYFYVSI